MTKCRVLTLWDKTPNFFHALFMSQEAAENRVFR
jgi:hypothetical protein